MKIEITNKLYQAMTRVIKEEKFQVAEGYMKASFKRRNGVTLNEFFIENYSNMYSFRKCNFCDDYIPFNFIYDLYEEYVIIKDIKYREKALCCRQKGCPAKKLNGNSVKFVSIAYSLSEEDALKKIHNRNKSPFYAENHSSEEDYIKWQTRDRKYFINRYGEKEGNQKANSVFSTISQKNKKDYMIETKGEDYANEVSSKKAITLENMIRLHGEKEGNIVYTNWKNKISSSLENCIERYGEEEGKLFYKRICDRTRYTNSLEYYIEKYGNDEGKKAWEERNKKCAITLDNQTKKWGEKEGPIKYQKWLKAVTYRAGGRASKESLKFLYPIIKDLFRLGLNKKDIEIDTSKKREYKLGYFIDNNTKFYYYDFVIPKLKLIIEYQGFRFHPNPNRLTEDQWKNWKPVWGTLTAEETYSKDIHKKTIAEEYDFKVFWVYSNDDLGKKHKEIVNYIKGELNDFK